MTRSKEERFVDWLLGEGPFPYFQDLPEVQGPDMSPWKIKQTSMIQILVNITHPGEAIEQGPILTFDSYEAASAWLNDLAKEARELERSDAIDEDRATGN